MANSNGWGDGAGNNAIGWGQGANNNIGWGDSHAKSWAGLTDIVGLTTDPDAQAFITAAAITDATQQAAINTLVEGMKTDGVWTKMKAIYPFVGGTASTHKYNLKDPRDLDAAFRLVFNGGWTHSSNGATPNGTNGWADTKLNGLSVLTNNNYHLSHYSRTQSITASAVDIGIQAAPQMISLTQYYAATSRKGFVCGDYVTSVVDSSDSNTLGFLVGSRTSQTSAKMFMNNAQSGSTLTLSNPNTIPNVAFAISATKTVASLQEYSLRQVAFTTIGDGLTDTEAANLYTRVQTYQTALSRQV
jgi:hypothetical protein